MTPRGATTLAGVAWLALGAAACARPDAPAQTVTLSVSLAEDEKEAVRELLERFRRESGIAVTLVSITAADLPEKLKVDARAGRPSLDLFAQDNLALRVLVDEGLVETLDDVGVPDGVLPSMIPPRFGGRQYFLPFRPNVRVTYVNRRRFAQAGVAPPRTLDELRAVGRALKRAARGTPKVTLPLAEGAPAAVTLSGLIVAFGGDPLLLNDAGSVRAFQYVRTLWQEGLLAPESLLAKYDTQVDYLVGETAWLAPNWPFTSRVLASQSLHDRFLVYDGWRGPVRAAHVIGGDVLGIPKGVAGRRREAAVRLAQFLMTRETQQLLVERNAWPAIRQDAYARVPLAQRETFDAVQRALADGWYRPSVPYWADVSDAMNDALRRIVQAGEPAQAVLDALHARIAAAARRKGAVYPPRAAARTGILFARRGGRAEAEAGVTRPRRAQAARLR